MARKSSSRQQPSSTSSRGRRDRKGSPGAGRRKSCPYCQDKVDVVDYKDFGGVRRQLSEKGQIRSARVTGCRRRHQRQLARAVKRARELGLQPYVSQLIRLMAQAILMQDVDTLGEKGDVVDVSPGYRWNFLVPLKLAQPATAGSVADAQRRKDAA